MPFKKAVFLDQTAILAYLNHESFSQNHELANNWIVSFFKEPNRDYDLLVTSDYVIMNVAEKLYNEFQDYQDVLTFIEHMIKSTSMKIININEEGFFQACRKLRTYHEILQLNFSLTDVSTLFILHSSRVKAILTFNPLIHRLEYMINFDFDPDMQTTKERLTYDAIPNNFFKDEIKKEFVILGKKVRPKEAISLFDLELSGWIIAGLDSKLGKVTYLKLDYSYKKDIVQNKRSLPSSICKLRKILHLDLSNNDISNLNNENIAILSELNSLQKLNLSENGLESIPLILKESLNENCEILI